QQREDGLRRAGAGAHPEPAEAHEVDAALDQGGDVGQVLEPRGRRYRQDLELLGLVLRDDRQRRRDVEVHAPRHQLLHHLGTAAERNAVHGDAGELFELAGENLLRRAGADGGVTHLAGMRLGVVHERLEVIGGGGGRGRGPGIGFWGGGGRGGVGQLGMGGLVGGGGCGGGRGGGGEGGGRGGVGAAGA